MLCQLRKTHVVAQPSRKYGFGIKRFITGFPNERKGRIWEISAAMQLLEDIWKGSQKPIESEYVWMCEDMAVLSVTRGILYKSISSLVYSKSSDDYCKWVPLRAYCMFRKLTETTAFCFNLEWQPGNLTLEILYHANMLLTHWLFVRRRQRGYHRTNQTKAPKTWIIFTGHIGSLTSTMESMSL